MAFQASLTTLTFIGILVASIAASQASHHVVHEKHDGLPAKWSKREKLEGYIVLPVRIGLTQQNLHRGEEWLMEVSDPKSPKFGQHWTPKQVAETFAPSEETVAAVKEWLAYAGIEQERVSVSQSLNWLTFSASTTETEQLLKTKYYIYEHESGHTQVACEEYSIPASVSQHIDFIMPTVHLNGKIVGDATSKKSEKRSLTAAANSDGGLGVGLPGDPFYPKRGKILGNTQIFNGLSQCNEYITPECLRALYKIPEGDSTAEGNSYGIVEYTPQAYLQADLDMFFQNYTSVPAGTAPILRSIDGGVDQTTDQGFDYNGESDLDFEYAMSLVHPQTVTLFQVGDTIESGSFNTFLDALDSSYCKYEGGDDPTIDPKYPDPSSGGYKGHENCGRFNATNVISTSYGMNEADITPFYANRQCHEYMKLGLQGVTILYSSGDSGVAGNGGECTGPSGDTFNPGFPSTCPYITSVGATQIKPNASVTAHEEACETVIYSGGGFSNVFGIPSYQAKTVKSWFKDHPPPYGADKFNNSQETRGYPDVSANGANYVVAVDGTYQKIYGTSCSSPVFGAIITLINEKRLAKGKSPVGFLNPTIYANPDAFNDIVEGGNQGCGTAGFTATSGWDPVTGLGTPNYEALLKVYLSLP